MTSKRNESGLSDAEMQKLLTEISEFEDNIQPMSLEEIEEIEANIPAIDVPLEIDVSGRQEFEEIRKDMAQNFIPLSGIIIRADQLKIDRQEMARQLRLGTDILMKLERRLLNWIPDTLVKMVADILQVSKGDLYRYLLQQPDHINLAASSKQTPTGNRTQTWQEAIKTSLMSDEDKAFWLNQT